MINAEKKNNKKTKKQTHFSLLMVVWEVSKVTFSCCSLNNLKWKNSKSGSNHQQKSSI
jgi:hypothetical protein